MKRLSINHLAALLLSFCSTPSHAMERGSKELSHEMVGSPLRHREVIADHPRSVLKITIGRPGREKEPDLSLSSSYLSEDETADDEEEEEEIPQVAEPKPPMNLPEFAVVQQAYEDFHYILADIHSIQDVRPFLESLDELAANMKDMDPSSTFWRSGKQSLWSGSSSSSRLSRRRQL